MAIELVTKFLPLVDEVFASESKTALLTNKNFDFDGAHTVKIWKIGTAEMNDYGRTGAEEGNWSRYGKVLDLDATTETMTLRKDRSFTYVIDRLDEDESGLEAAKALSRQLRQVVIPEVDLYTISEMAANAGHKPDAAALTADNIYDEIIKGSNALDKSEAPEKDRSLVVTPDTYLLLKRCKDIAMETDIGNEMRLKGIIAMVDGMPVIRVPAARVPAGFGFMIAHPIATVGVEKLAAYKMHHNPPGISGTLTEGRIVYDAFVLENKAGAIYYHSIPTA
ncbi:MAG: hypothetical protein E7318_05575 [Clostridiales bacterium]|nr:hypothetical protein [Clostridiales bacterium]